MWMKNTETLRGYLRSAGHTALALAPGFILDGDTFENAKAEVMRQHPEEIHPDSRAAYRLLTTPKESPKMTRRPQRAREKLDQAEGPTISFDPQVFSPEKFGAALKDAVSGITKLEPKVELSEKHSIPKWLKIGFGVGVLLLLSVIVARGQTVVFKDEGTVRIRRAGGQVGIDFVGAGVSCSTPTAGIITCTISGGGATGYQTIEDEGSGLTQRTILNFLGAGVSCADNVTKTDCTISGGGGGSWSDLTDPTAVTVFNSGAVAELFQLNFTANYGATDVLFDLKQLTGNPLAGSILAKLTVNDPDMTPFVISDGTNNLFTFASDADTTIRNFSDSILNVILDSGATASQQTILFFRDRGTNEWSLSKTSGNGFVVTETGGVSRFALGALSGNTYRTGSATADHDFLNDTTKRITIHGDSDKISFGSAVDTCLERTAADTLSMCSGDSFTIGGDDVIHKGTNTLLSTENVVLDGSTNPRDITLGIIRVLQTPNIDSTRGIAVITDAAGFGDTKAIELDWTATGVAAGDFEAVIDIDIDTANSTGGNIIALEVTETTTGSATTYGMLTGVGINPLLNEAGSFGNVEIAFISIPGFTDVTADFNSTVSDVQMFVSNGDLVYIGMAAKFDEVEFILAVTASNAGIQPTFEYSDGASGWITFSPTDNTNGMRQNGDLVWIASALAGWAQDTVNAVSGKFWIRITRSAVTVSTPPTEDLVQANVDVDYVWDSSGNLNIASLSSGFNAEIADAGFIRLGNTETIAWELATPGTDMTFSVSANDKFTLGTLDCSAGDQYLTTNASGEIDCGTDDSAGSPTLDSIADPVAATDWIFGTTTETLLADFQAAFTTGPQVEFKQSVGNPTGGILVRITVPDVDVTPFEVFDGTNVVFSVAQDGTTTAGNSTAGGVSQFGGVSDTGASALEIFAGDAASNVEPSNLHLHQSGSANDAFLFPCNNDGQVCLSGSSPSADSGNVVMTLLTTEEPTNKTLDGGLATTTHAANANFFQNPRHATDCTAITDGKDGEFCWERDADTIYACENAAGCAVPGDWIRVTAAGGAGDITDVGPGCATGACWTDGLVTTGTTLLIWEGTAADANEFTISVPANPGADILWTVPDTAASLTFPTGTSTLATRDIDNNYSVTQTYADTVDIILDAGGNSFSTSIIKGIQSLTGASGAGGDLTLLPGLAAGQFVFRTSGATTRAELNPNTASFVFTNPGSPQWSGLQLTSDAAIAVGDVVKVSGTTDDRVITSTTSGDDDNFVGVAQEVAGAAGVVINIATHGVVTNVVNDGGCTRGDFAKVSATTAGRIECSTTFDQAMIGMVIASAATGAATDMLILPRSGSAGGTHAILSATHTDTTAATVVRGDVMTGQTATPLWQRRALGGTNLYLKSDGTDLVYSTLAAGGVGSCTNQFVSALNADAAPTCATVTASDTDETTFTGVTWGANADFVWNFNTVGGANPDSVLNFNSANINVSTGTLSVAGNLVVDLVDVPNAAGDISGDYSAGLTIDAGAVASAELAAANKTFVKSIVVIDPTTTEDDKVQWMHGSAVTYTSVNCSTDTGTATIDMDHRVLTTPNTVGTDILTGTIVCDTNNQADGGFADATIPASVPVNLSITAVASTPGTVRIHITYTKD